MISLGIPPQNSPGNPSAIYPIILLGISTPTYFSKNSFKDSHRNTCTDLFQEYLQWLYLEFFQRLNKELPQGFHQVFLQVFHQEIFNDSTMQTKNHLNFLLWIPPGISLDSVCFFWQVSAGHPPRSFLRNLQYILFWIPPMFPSKLFPGISEGGFGISSRTTSRIYQNFFSEDS